QQRQSSCKRVRARQSGGHRRWTRAEKKHPEVVRGPVKLNTDYFAPRIASLAALATRNFTTRLARIWICSPVAGLRPIRAARLTSTSLPRPGSVKVFFACL